MARDIDRRRRTLLWAGLACLGQAAAPARAAGLDRGVALQEVRPGVWLHSSSPAPGAPKRNGLMVVGAAGALLIDPAATVEHTVALLEALKPVVAGRPTDFVALSADHARTLAQTGVRPYVLPRTAGEAEALGIGGLGPVLTQDRPTFELGGRRVELFFPGPGRAVDNAVAYETATRTLFGGQVVAARDSGARRDLEGADLAAWPLAVLNVAHAYRDAELVVPREGAPGGFELLVATEQRTSLARLGKIRATSWGVSRA